jgi:hypothetical protein
MCSGLLVSCHHLITLCFCCHRSASASANNENSAVLTATAGNGAFNPRASMPASTTSSLLPSAAAAVAAQSAMQQRFSTQTGSCFTFRTSPPPPLLTSSVSQPCCGRQAPAAARGGCVPGAQSFEPCRCARRALRLHCLSGADGMHTQGVGFSATSAPVSGLSAAVPAKGAWRSQR